MPHHLVHSFVFLKRIGIAFLIFFLSRLIFFIFNYSYFTGSDPMLFIYALRFDMSAIAFIYSPFIILSVIPFHLKSAGYYQKSLGFLFHLSNTIALVLNCIDIEYFKFTLKRTTSDIFVLVGFGKDFVSLIPQFAFDFWYVLVICASLLFLSAVLYKRTAVARHPLQNIQKFYAIETLVFFFFSAAFVLGARGGLQLRPVNIINANEYTHPRNIPLVLNTPFTVIKTIFEESIRETKYFPDAGLDKFYSPVHHYRRKEDFKKLNVVLIIMESFSNEYIGFMHPEVKSKDTVHRVFTCTPFLDSLAGHSLVFDRCYANGKKSIEGVPAIVAALPSLMNNPFISSSYSANKINSLASILRQEGYQASFFHGGTNGTMGFDAFSSAAGFDKYFGRYEYNNDADYDGHWGIYDEEFFQYFAGNLDKTQEPFLGCFFSLSSHHPFTIPEKYGSAFKEGKLKIHKSIQYADLSLRKFFETASKSKWFDNTLFIITSDHTSTTTLPFYNSPAGVYSIPLMFYSPGRISPGLSHKITQQTDIMPSALDFLNYGKEFIAFGQSALSPDSPGFSVSYINNIYQIITEDHVLQFDGEETAGLYRFKNGLLVKNNILAADSFQVKTVEQKLRAIIQSYNHRLINNKLVVK